MPWFDQAALKSVNFNIKAACHYRWPVDRLIHLYKYQGQLDLLPVLTDLLLQLPKPEVQAMIATPLSADRLKQRGFNQSLLLAKQLSKQWQIPLWRPLQRHHTLAQQHSSRSERLTNLRQAFYPDPAQCRIIPRKVVVIDDVFTTGSTLTTIEEQLLSLGVQNVVHYVVAAAAQ